MTRASDQTIDVGGMIEGIRRWVENESPTRNKAAVNRMLDLVAADLDGLPVHVERIAGRDGYADMLKLRAGESETPGILVLSHIDTVHPIGTLAGALPFRRDGDRLYGPGLYDMKGGAYLAFDAFRAVARAGSARLPIVYLFTPDEEVGSPISREVIESEARRARYVLVTEPARDGGKIVTSRKGVGRFEMRTTGVPAHSGWARSSPHAAFRRICCGQRAGHEVARSVEAAKAGRARIRAEGLAAAPAVGQSTWLLRAQLRRPRGRFCPSPFGCQCRYRTAATRYLRHQPLPHASRRAAPDRR